MRIYKYPLEVTDRQIIAVRNLKRILSAIVQDESIMLYCLVGDAASSDTDTMVEIQMRGTGHTISFDLVDYIFLGTLSMMDGNFITHVFAREVPDES